MTEIDLIELKTHLCSIKSDLRLMGFDELGITHTFCKMTIEQIEDMVKQSWALQAGVKP